MLNLTGLTRDLEERKQFLNARHFQCAVSGKRNLTYAQALASEQAEGLESSRELSQAVLKAMFLLVIYRVSGRLDALVDHCYDRLRHRFWPGEIVWVTGLTGPKLTRQKGIVQSVNKTIVLANAGVQTTEIDLEELHREALDLDRTREDIDAHDSPRDYLYTVRMLTGNTQDVMQVRFDAMGRDRFSWSRSNIKKILKDSIFRESDLSSPWLVKEYLVEAFGLPSEIPESLRIRNEQIRQELTAKRKRDAQLESQMVLVRRKDGTIVEQKVPKFPLEDLDDLVLEADLEEREKELAMQRPRFNTDTPLPQQLMSSLLSTWSMLNTFGEPLQLTSFTLDDYINALKEQSPETGSVLLVEVLSCLVNVLITENYLHRLHLPLTKIDLNMYHALSDKTGLIGQDWQRAKLQFRRDRQGWVETIMGYLRNRCSQQNVPDIVTIFDKVFYKIDNPAAQNVSMDETEDPEIPKPPTHILADIYVTFWTLSPAERLQIIEVLVCDVISTRGIAKYMDTCEQTLTDMRKERMELTKSKKELLKAKATTANQSTHSLIQKPSEEDQAAEQSDGGSEHDSSRPMEEQEPEPEEEPVSKPARKGRRGEKASAEEEDEMQPDEAEEGEAKPADEGQELEAAETQNDVKDEAFERDFYALLCVQRPRSLGKDRFYHSYWWLDGTGGQSLISETGDHNYGTGRIFVCGPNAADRLILASRNQEQLKSLISAQGAQFLETEHHWASYDTVEDVEQIWAWLHYRGTREHQLRRNVGKWWEYILGGIQRRMDEENGNFEATLPDKRTRNARVLQRAKKPMHERHAYYVNIRALNAPVK